jgi:hypothetical protein
MAGTGVWVAVCAAAADPTLTTEPNPAPNATSPGG